METFKTIFWTSIFWLFVFAGAFGYVRFLDMELAQMLFPQDETTVVDQTIEEGQTMQDLQKNVEEIIKSLENMQEDIDDSKDSLEVLKAEAVLNAQNDTSTQTTTTKEDEEKTTITTDSAIDDKKDDTTTVDSTDSN
ncbi:hypothetical protein GW750_07650 [bacterium]|nr:hypothetical protein [bacterium]